MGETEAMAVKIKKNEKDFFSFHSALLLIFLHRGKTDKLQIFANMQYKKGKL